MLSSTSCVFYQHGSEYIRKVSLLGASPNTLFLGMGIRLLVQLFQFRLTREAEKDKIAVLSISIGTLKALIYNELSVGSRVDNKSDAKNPLVSRHQIWHKMVISVNQGQILKTQQVRA